MDKNLIVAVLSLAVAVISLILQFVSTSADRLKNNFSIVKSVIWRIVLFVYPICVCIYYSLYKDFNKEYVLVVTINLAALCFNIINKTIKEIYDKFYERNSYQSDLNLKYFSFVNDNKVATTRILLALLTKGVITKDVFDELLKKQESRLKEIQEKLLNLPKYN